MSSVKELDGKFIIVFDEGLSRKDSDRLQDKLANALEEYGLGSMIYSSVTGKVMKVVTLTVKGEESA